MGKLNKIIEISILQAFDFESRSELGESFSHLFTICYNLKWIGSFSLAHSSLTQVMLKRVTVIKLELIKTHGGLSMWLKDGWVTLINQQGSLYVTFKVGYHKNVTELPLGNFNLFLENKKNFFFWKTKCLTKRHIRKFHKKGNEVLEAA